MEADLAKATCVSHFSKRSYSFLFIHTATQTKYETFVMQLPKILVYRQCGHCKGLYVSNKCLLTTPLKIDRWVYTWIHFSAAAALPRQC